MSKDKNKVDKLSLFVATLALVFSVWQGFENRYHNKLTQRPHLDLSLRASDGAMVRGIRLDNAGLGPAIIKSISFSVNGSPVSLSENDISIGKNIYTKVLDDIGWPQELSERKRILVTTLPEDAWILHGDEVFIFKLESKMEFEEYQKFRSLEVTIDYNSMYGESCRIFFDPKLEKAYEHISCSSWL